MMQGSAVAKLFEEMGAKPDGVSDWPRISARA